MNDQSTDMEQSNGGTTRGLGGLGVLAALVAVYAPIALAVVVSQGVREGIYIVLAAWALEGLVFFALSGAVGRLAQRNLSGSLHGGRLARER